MRINVFTILSLLFASNLAMATTRYTEPIPEGIPVLETNSTTWQTNIPRGLWTIETGATTCSTTTAPSWPLRLMRYARNWTPRWNKRGDFMPGTWTTRPMLFLGVIMRLRVALTRAVIPMLCVAHIVTAMFVRRANIGVFDYGLVLPLGEVDV
ncbi:hypothetical protein KXW97_009605 [Aspergillus fumigatus]|nr:hypothetical protein KXW97_009605 [Aspergillus fumigatus]